MADFGTLCLFLALAASGWAVIASLNGWRARLGELVLSAERAVYATWALVLLSVLSLEYCIFTDQFGLEYVASYSNRALPRIYKFTALWGGQAGSLLFWELVLITYTSLIVLTNRRRNRSLLPLVVTTLAFVSTFFLGLVNFMSRPFVRLAFSPEDGNGLNPQLQNPFMAIHPPCLYLGYVGLTLPFAFAIAALATGRLDDTWFRTTRRWTILSWFFLGTGILLGGWWAYVELGWGGYWAWDPVENASLIPWLTCTAFLHSVMIEERKKMLRVWNLSLVIMSFLLAILGTFITGSGVIPSVHSFTKSNVGPVFAGFLGFSVLVSVGLLLHRLPDLKSEHRLDSFVSRESTFLFNNLLLVGAAFAVLWGTLFPILSEAVRGLKITVGPPFFNEVMIPIAFALVTPARIAGTRRCAGGLPATRALPRALTGAPGAAPFTRQPTARLNRGDSCAVGRYRMAFQAMVSDDNPTREFMGARLAIFDGDRPAGTLVPGQNFYKTGQNPSTEVDIRYTLRDDLYLILTGFDPQEGRATLKAYLNPLVNWIWIGGGVLILGAWFAMLPDIRDRRRDAEARLREVESRAA